MGDDRGGVPARGRAYRRRNHTAKHGGHGQVGVVNDNQCSAVAGDQIEVGPDHRGAGAAARPTVRVGGVADEGEFAGTRVVDLGQSV